MIVLNISCKNFRNLENINISPCDGMNVICGENAQGKTNILESIWLFTGAKSFRTNKDNNFIKFGTEKAVCRLDFKSEGIKKIAEITIKDKREVALNGKRIKSASEFAGNFKAIVFSPVDLSLVSDGPSVRRKFLDTAIGQLYPSYINILKNYIRAVTQRNKIIKDFKYDSTLSIMLDVYENEISQNGEKIVNFRKRYIEVINEFLGNVYDGISGGREKIETEYISSYSNDLTEKLKFSRKEDMYSGVTSIGPHRDDLEFKINGISARNFASQGQKRSIALAVKLSEAEVIKKNVGECPVILLDDVMSELDPLRQDFVLNHIKGMQSFLTCCDESNIKNLIAGEKFIIKNGRVV